MNADGRGWEGEPQRHQGTKDAREDGRGDTDQHCVTVNAFREGRVPPLSILSPPQGPRQRESVLAGTPGVTAAAVAADGRGFAEGGTADERGWTRMGGGTTKAPRHEGRKGRREGEPQIPQMAQIRCPARMCRGKGLCGGRCPPGILGRGDPFALLRASSLFVPLCTPLTRVWR